MPKLHTDEVFIETWQRLGSASEVAAHLGMSPRAAFTRRRSIEAKFGIALAVAKEKKRKGIKDEIATRLDTLAAERARVYKRDIQKTIKDGVVMVASDCHYWPLIVTKAHQAFCAAAKKLKPAMIVLNGDVLDGARISRHARIMWEKTPELKDEVAAVQDRCAEIERAGNGAELIRTIGNHDARWETFLSGRVGEFEQMSGMTLLDYLPRWEAGWALHINVATEGWTTIRHRPVSGGIHSGYNSTLKAGTHYVHGHLHKLSVTPWSDYRGRRYGVDCGTLAEPLGPQFNYTEAGPSNWTSGFAVLTYRDGILLPPELAVVDRGAVWFRGERL